MPLTPYNITIWKLAGHDDAVESRFECYAETERSSIELWDCLTRGIRGHYRAWLTDTTSGRVLRESAVTYKG